MATFNITPETAARAERMIAHHNGDIAAAAHDIYIGLQSLGDYTDRKSEAVHGLLRYILRTPADVLPTRLEQLHAIAAKAAL